MKYTALLRGINVGGNRKVDMKILRRLFEEASLTEVETYLNSGNVIFNSDKGAGELTEIIMKLIEAEFGFEVVTLVISQDEIKRIVSEIPENWQNDADQKTDIAFLFSAIDYPEIIDELPVKKEFLDISYTPGAVIWHVERQNQNKSQLSKLAGHKYYKQMTVRNINTARYLSGL